jgi:hypothetical protein
MLIPKCAILISVIIYLVFHVLQCRRIQDEREDFIKHKTFKFSQRLTTLCLLSLSVINFYVTQMDSNTIISTLVFSALYSEILASFYFRSKY